MPRSPRSTKRAAHLEAALRAADYDPPELERIEERLFALRAAGRKYNVPVDELAALGRRYEADLALIDAGEERLAKLEQAAREAAGALPAGRARRSPTARRGAARDARQGGQCRAQAAQARAGPILHRDRRATADAPARTASTASNSGCSTNPGTRPGPLMKVASGGELARFLLALKVVLADRGSAPTLVFDEIDTGVGGAVADAIGVRLARLAARVQVLAVTHAPQVAARADRHYLISQGRAGQGQAGRHPRQRARRRAPPRGDRPHAGRRRDHRRGPRRRRAPDQGGGVVWAPRSASLVACVATSWSSKSRRSGATT